MRGRLLFKVSFCLRDPDRKILQHHFDLHSLASTFDDQTTSWCNSQTLADFGAQILLPTSLTEKLRLRFWDKNILVQVPLNHNQSKILIQTL